MNVSCNRTNAWKFLNSNVVMARLRLKPTRMIINFIFDNVSNWNLFIKKKTGCPLNLSSRTPF